METSLTKEFETAQEGLQDFNNPFLKEKVTLIMITCFPQNKYNSNWNSSIEFKEGNTEGTQKFENKNLSDLLEQMKNFVDNL